MTAQTPGGRREDTSQQVSAAVAAVMAGAQLALLGLLAAAVSRVLHGGARRKAGRDLHAAAAATMTAAADRMTRDLHVAGRRIVVDTTAALNTSRRPQRTIAGVPVGEPTPTFEVPAVSPEWRRFLVRVHQATGVAVGEVGDVFHRITTALHGDRSTSTAQALLDEAAAQGITVYTDTAGRRWQLPVYVQMAVRTACTRLAIATQFRLMAEHGMDLVMVDKASLAAACPRCAPFESRVLSMFGGTPAGSMATVVDARGERVMAVVVTTVADAVSQGLLHPQCRHSLVPFTDGMVMVTPPSVHVLSYRDGQRRRALERVVRGELAARAVALTPLRRARVTRRLVAARSNLDAHVRTYHRARKAG